MIAFPKVKASGAGSNPSDGSDDDDRGGLLHSLLQSDSRSSKPASSDNKSAERTSGEGGIRSVREGSERSEAAERNAADWENIRTPSIGGEAAERRAPAVVAADA